MSIMELLEKEIDRYIPVADFRRLPIKIDGIWASSIFRRRAITDSAKEVKEFIEQRDRYYNAPNGVAYTQKLYSVRSLIEYAIASGWTITEIPPEPPKDEKLRDEIQFMVGEKDKLRKELLQIQETIDWYNKTVSSYELKNIKTIHAITGKRICSKSEILAAAAPIGSHCGIYFLIEDNEVVYVGQSVNIYTRMSDHKKHKKFDNVAFIECSSRELDVLESIYINFFNPKLNGRHTIGGKLCAPVNSESLIHRYIDMREPE